MSKSSKNIRNTRDRVRHAVLFELTALALVTPLFGLLLGIDMSHFGVVAVVATTIAMLWNYGYNLIFDHAMLRLFASAEKSVRVRIVHAVLFEGGLLVLLVPFIAWYLAMSLWQALVMDISLAGFYLVYAFAFNWVYDAVFPVRGAVRT